MSESPSGQHPAPAINRPKKTGADTVARLSRKTRKSPKKSGILFRGYGADPPARHSQDNCDELQRKADHSTDRPAHTPPNKPLRKVDHTPTEQSIDLPAHPALNSRQSVRNSGAPLKGQRTDEPHLSRDDRDSWRAWSQIHDLERQLDAMKLQFIHLANLVHDLDSEILTSFFNNHGGIGMSHAQYLEADIELLETSARVENKSPMNNASWNISPRSVDNNVAMHLAALDLNILRRAERTGGPADFQRVAQAINNQLAPDKRTLHKPAVRDSSRHVTRESRAVSSEVDDILPQGSERVGNTSPTSRGSRKDTARSPETDNAQSRPANASQVNDDTAPALLDSAVANHRADVDLSTATRTPRTGSPGEFQRLAQAINRKLASDKRALRISEKQQTGTPMKESKDSAVGILLRRKEVGGNK